jgi:outer membrane immunogenic protein
LSVLHRSAVDTGYVVGGGVEYKIAPAWSLKGEYQYINLGTDTVTSAPFTLSPTDTVRVKFNNDFSTVRVGVNYHFGLPYEPLK